MVKTTGNNRGARLSVFQTIVPPVTPAAVTGVGITRGFYVTIPDNRNITHTVFMLKIALKRD
jgi:hypothetical protein